MIEAQTLDAILPTSVRIGPFDYAVEEFSPKQVRDSTHLGQHHSDDLTIKVCPEMPDQRIAEVLLHEILHGIWFVAGLRDKGDEETIVERTTLQLLQVWRDNPAVMAFIAQKMGLA